MHPKILLAEDDNTLGYALKTYLEMHQFKVSWQKDGEMAKEAFLNPTWPYVI